MSKQKATVKWVESNANNSDTEEWSGEEKKLYKQLAGEMPVLGFPLEDLVLPNGQIEQVYNIPAELVFQTAVSLWPFLPEPTAETEFVDVHCDKKFKFKEAKIIRFDNRNMLVSPFYAEKGGTVLDFIDPSCMGKSCIDMPCKPMDNNDSIELLTTR